jgi:phosphoribosyl-AMP cyclohydrolase
MSVLPVTFDPNGLVPVVVQDDATNQVLMMAFMNRDALDLTRSTGEVHFWSRSRNKLWHKGEISGHVQKVRSININCNQDSLLIRVEQIGACCHTGHASCYFREVDAEGQLITHGEPRFDPEAVYADSALRDQAVRWIGAYAWLADNDLSDVSGTSKLLHTGTVSYLASRVADELGEVRGVLDGSHSHAGPNEDIVLEGSQALYWIALTAIRAGADPSEIAADINHGSVVTGNATLSELAAQFEVVRRRWADLDADSIAQLISETVPLLAESAAQLDSNLHEMLAHDLADLEGKSYLAPYFPA